MSNTILHISELALIVMFSSIAIIAVIYSMKRQKAVCSKIHEQEITIGNLTKTYEDTLGYYKNKAEYYINIVHELKTPISVILGAIQLYEQKSSVSGQQNSLNRTKIIKQNCYRMLRLINNLLETAKIDSGCGRLNTIDVDIVGLTEEITQSVIPFAAQKGIRMLFDTEAEEIRTSLDVDKMERILLNLLSNAVKFTPSSGSIMVTVKSSKDTVSISVKDSGPGIPQNKQAQIFDRFRQSGDRAEAEKAGSGLGLSIAKSLAELMGGNIKLISELGKGSDFIVELPIISNGEEAEPVSAVISNNRIFDARKIELSDIYESVNTSHKLS